MGNAYQQSRIERGASALDAYAAKNVIPMSIDLSGYDDDEEVTDIKPASYFIEKTKDIINGKAVAHGTPLPWRTAQGKFAFRKGELTIWTGYKGHGKSAMLSHCMLYCMKLGERVMVISPEFKAQDVLARKVRQAGGGSRPSDQFIDRWFNWAGERLWLLDQQGSVQAQKVLALTRYAIDKFGVNHVVVDSLMKCGIGTDDYNRQKWFVDKLQSIAHTTNAHIHLVAHARKGESDDSPAKLHDVKGTSEIADMAENVVSVWKNKPKLTGSNRRASEKDPDGLMLVDSQRNGDGWVGIIPLWFDPASLQFKESDVASAVRYEPDTSSSTEEVEEF